MTVDQFIHMYHNSAEIRVKVTRWLVTHPAPEGVPPLKWAFSEFISASLSGDMINAAKNAHDRDRFKVPQDQMLAEAKGRAKFGEDAGAAMNEELGKKNIKRARDANNPEDGIRWEGDQ